MFAYIWPIVLVVVSNIFYHICAKSAPGNVNPFLTVTVTYIVGAVFSAILFLITGRGTDIASELKNINWVPFVFGLVIVGLEAGNIYAYKAGWQVSVESIVQNSVLAVALIFVAYFLFHEAITWNKIVGMIICLVGLVFINLK